MLFKDRSTCISIDLVVGNNISICLIIGCELKLGFELGFWVLLKICVFWCVVIIEKVVLCITNDVVVFYKN